MLQINLSVISVMVNIGMNRYKLQITVALMLIKNGRRIIKNLLIVKLKLTGAGW